MPWCVVALLQRYRLTLAGQLPSHCDLEQIIVAKQPQARVEPGLVAVGDAAVDVGHAPKALVGGRADGCELYAGAEQVTKQ